MFIEVVTYNTKKTIHISLIESFGVDCSDEERTMIVLKGDEFLSIDETYDHFINRLAIITEISRV